MRILVTGGAGYIGSVTVERLRAKGEQVVVLDDFVRGHRAALEGGQPVRHFEEDLADFRDTAALVALMDVVITVDTSIAHLAGGMGKTAWILLPFSPDWRWLLDRDDSPWYPSAQLFRQPRPGDWDTVLERVAAELRVLASPSR